MRLSILVKISIIIALVASVAISITAYVNVRSQKNLLESIYREKGESFANSLNAAISDTDLANPALLQNTIYKFILLNPDVVNVSLSFIDSQKQLKIGASSDVSRIGLPSNVESEHVFTTHEAASEHVHKYNDHRIVVFAPIDLNGEHVGVNETHIRIDQAEMDVNQLTWILSGMFTLSFLVIIGATLFLVYFSISRNVRLLTSAVARVGKGDLSQEVSIRANDEIGDMAQGFNAMLVQLRSYRDDMEKKITDRTNDLEKRTREVEDINKLMVGREIKMIELKKKLSEFEAKLKI
ncbi:HAMP domain-containing protein [Candidatus Gottesmanbacteria bacterium]|nr:HAMP domain-containing protein [Candidatus Gottesmanbacteria bacterium]